MKVGIGLITYNRPETCLRAAKAIRETSTNANYVCVIDGGDWRSYDDWIFNNYTVIVGQNMGGLQNKNRALNYLQACDVIILIEDDLIPIKSGWVEYICNVLKETNYEHLTCVVPANKKDIKLISLSGEIELWPKVSGPLMVMTKKCLEKVGIGDPNYKGYGHGHTDYTRRCKKAGIYPDHGWVNLKRFDEYFKYMGDIPATTSIEDRKKDLVHNSAYFKKDSNKIYIGFNELFI